MSHQRNDVYIHLVWTTKNREPLITSFLEEELYACILAKCQELSCIPVAIGGVEDHVHLLVRLYYSISISQLVSQLKGASSFFAGCKLRDKGVTFRWQRGYGVFSVDCRNLEPVIQYIRSQKMHHYGKQLVSEWEPVRDSRE